LGFHVRQHELRVLEIGDAFAELLALLHVRERAIERILRAAKRTGGDVEAPAIEPLHRVLEALALWSNTVLDRHAAIFEVHDRGRLRTPAHLVFVLAEAEALGPIFNEHR